MQGTSPPSISARIDSVTRQRTMHYAVLQGLCWAVMFGVGECYFSLFATHIHAPQFFFGLLAGGPVLLGPISQLFGAEAVDHTHHRKKYVLRSVLIQSICYAPLAYLPFLASEETTRTLLLALIVIYFAGAHFCVPAWNSWISVIVPSEERANWFAKISRAQGIISLITKLMVAAGLYFASRLPQQEEHATVLVIFSVSFAVAGVSRFGGYMYLRKMYEPEYEHAPDARFTFWQFIRRTRESNFVKFVLYVSLVYFGALIAGPYFLPYTVYTLHWEQWQWVMLESAGAVSSILTLMFWGSFSHRFGNKKTLKYTGAIISIIPLLWLPSTNFYYLVAINTVSGFSWAGFNLCTFNYILEAVSPPKRARCVAYFNLLVGIGSFCGSMLGAGLIKVLPLTVSIGSWTYTAATPFIYVLVLSSTTRLLMNLFLGSAFNELRQVEPFELKDLVFYISEMRVTGGLRFGALANPPEDSEDKEKQQEDGLSL
jgi:MFS family permease